MVPSALRGPVNVHREQRICAGGIGGGEQRKRLIIQQEKHEGIRSRRSRCAVPSQVQGEADRVAQRECLQAFVEEIAIRQFDGTGDQGTRDAPDHAAISERSSGVKITDNDGVVVGHGVAVNEIEGQMRRRACQRSGIESQLQGGRAGGRGTCPQKSRQHSGETRKSTKIIGPTQPGGVKFSDSASG